jgi:hypothetical protein
VSTIRGVTTKLYSKVGGSKLERDVSREEAGREEGLPMRVRGLRHGYCAKH